MREPKPDRYVVGKWEWIMYKNKAQTDDMHVVVVPLMRAHTHMRNKNNNGNSVYIVECRDTCTACV